MVHGRLRARTPSLSALHFSARRAPSRAHLLAAARSPFLALLLAAASNPVGAAAQDDAVLPPQSDTTVQTAVPNATAGEFTPGRGFDVYRSDLVSLNISFYGLFRYVGQFPSPQTFVDHLGRERDVDPRNDLNWHRTMVWLTGFFFVPDFKYNITLWSLPTTQQTLLFGNFQYRFSPGLNAAVGIAPNRTVRSMQGSWPFWAGSDRQMAEDFFRGGFSSGFFVYGQVVPRLYYSASVNTNLSQLGVTAANDTRDFAVSGSLEWLPSTGEFGPRGGFGDFEHHETVATRFGVSGAHARESRYAADSLPPNATQIRLSDGVFPFETGALAEGVTVQTLDYDVLALDAAFKYRGFSLQAEYYFRLLSDFVADGPLPDDEIFDHGFMVEAMHMVVRQLVGVYAVSGFVFDEFERNPWELGGGVSVYPSRTRSWRLNLHVLHVDQSPAGSSFGYYNAGLTGTILSLGTDILF
jgi:hypothetical protein